jgi:hypothetical protein
MLTIETRNPPEYLYPQPPNLVQVQSISGILQVGGLKLTRPEALLLIQMMQHELRNVPE